MRKRLLVVVLLALTAATTCLAWPRPRRLSAQPMPAPETDSTDRVAEARVSRGKIIKEKYQAAAVKYPGQIFVRWFKREAVLELWARPGRRPFQLVATYPILSSPGGPGPKRREGDRQVPEGFYEVDRFNPKSNFHLSLGLNYPNAADRVHADPQKPGGDIFIHGSDVSVGCAPLGDEAIEEVYFAALDARNAGQQRIFVHILPARMSGPEWESYAAAETARRPDLTDFWAQLKPGYEAFERTHLVPEIGISKDGRYTIRNR